MTASGVIRWGRGGGDTDQQPSVACLNVPERSRGGGGGGMGRVVCYQNGGGGEAMTSVELGGGLGK
jgi:hypothetical protein